MRITAGILMTVSLFCIPFLGAKMPIWESEKIEEMRWVVYILCAIPIILLIMDIIFTFARRYPVLALTGTIISIVIGFFMQVSYSPLGIIFIPVGLLAMIFLIVSIKRGEFRGRWC